MANKISAVIITKNEVAKISNCLQSLHTVTDDIIVIDSGSVDGTIQKAEHLGARVFETIWKGFGSTKNFGNLKAKYDWILSLDADEVLSTELRKELINLVPENGNIYAIDRKNIYLGKEIKFSGWSPDWVYRIFNKNEAQWNDNLVHEKLESQDDSKIIKLKGKLIHHSYLTLEDHKSKIERYASLRAQTWITKAKDPGFFKRYFGPSWKAFKSYILDLGFLDGKAGWRIANMNYYLVKRQFFYFDQLKSSNS
jgi:glycosyltransferase involved in cell wall biosynthesis